MKTQSMRLRAIALLALLMALALVSGCASSPDSVEDPLSKYNGASVDSLLPFATTDPDLLPTESPSPTPWAPQDTAPATAAPTDSDTVEMSYGSSGDSVMRLQARLKALGYFNGLLDGKYGESTASAVRLFEGQLNIQKTGIASVQLQERLYATDAPRYSTGIPSDEDPYDDLDDSSYDDDDFDPPPIRTPTPARTPTPTKQGYQALSRGDKGTAVSDLQRALKQLGYYTGAIDGDYGSATVNAVKRFQWMYNQTQDGVASVSLQTKLFSGDAMRYEAPATPTPAPAAEYTTLEWGDYGAAVTRLQKRLRTLKYMSDPADGEYGDSTMDAVMLFQKAIGAQQTGVATAALQKKLFASSAPAYAPKTTPTPNPDKHNYVQLKPGDTGEKVKTLQRRLKKLGYFNGEIGGNYLTLTTDAVKRFQKQLGLETTGIATVALQKRLFADDAPAYEKPKPTATPKPEGGYKQLKEGDSSKAVGRLQQRLKDLGYYDGQITNGYGKNTTAAVKLFQKACDLKQTGVASADLQRLLFSDEAPNRKQPAAAPSDQPKYSKLKPGDTGSKVKTLQKRLKELGYFNGDIGGNYLTKTTNAVKAFQKALGWEQTGVATTDLQEKLFSDSAPSKSAKSELKALKYKDTGTAVHNLQVRLMELGFMDGLGDDKDGTYGKATRAAVIAAQLARGFDSDGNADLEFMKFIMSDEAYLISDTEYER